MKIRKINRFVIGYILGLGFLAFLGYTAGDYTARLKERQDHLTNVSSKKFATDVGFVDLPRMNMSISSVSGQTGRVRIDMSLEVEQKDLGRFEDFQPIITDRLIGLVRKLDMDEMSKPNAVPTLRKEFLKEVNTVSYPVPVLDIIFKQFVIM